ncbi:DoxX family protein [Methylocella sp.]|uniref:DoxX family protein n=1 Tax=Methylocella sp. TaxID=1978226 RepID=UPI0037835A80
MTTDQRTASGALVPTLADLVERALLLVRRIAPADFVQLVARVALAVPFWRSGVLKWDGFLQVNDTAVTLFSDEFMLHLPGGPYPFPAPAAFAFLSGSGEIVFPILLVLGLGARFAALGLLVMTLIVELTVPEGWPIHLTWAAMALGVMAWGPGAVSLDALIDRFWRDDRRDREQGGQTRLK